MLLVRHATVCPEGHSGAIRVVSRRSTTLLGGEWCPRPVSRNSSRPIPIFPGRSIFNHDTISDATSIVRSRHRWNLPLPLRYYRV